MTHQRIADYFEMPQYSSVSNNRLQPRTWKGYALVEMLAGLFNLIGLLMFSNHAIPAKMNITIKDTRDIRQDDVIEIYKANHWSSAQKPEKLFNALLNSHSLVTAWDGEKLVGLGNALSDGYLVVYYPHLIIHPDYQGMGIGQLIISKFQEKYEMFHQQILVADGKAIDFYEKCGFELAGETKSMWIYQGDEH